MKTFFDLVGTDVRPHTSQQDGMDYIPWATAVGLSGLIPYQTPTFEGSTGPSPCRALFGGLVVGIDMPISGEKGAEVQRVCLPVLNKRHRPIEAGKETARDVSDAHQRCLARAIAVVHGLGLSLYSPCKGDGVNYLEYLAVTPATKSLLSVEPLVDQKEIKDKVTGKVKRSTPYLGWHSAVAAARITDPTFLWEVVEYPYVDAATGVSMTLPAMKCGKGWMVAVRTRYKGEWHEQWLPIMGVEVVKTMNGDKPMEHQAIDAPSVFQWHSAVMRCLAKGIATQTGYGLSIYAKCDADDLAELDALEDQSLSEGGGQAEAQASPASPDLVARVDELITTLGVDRKQFIAWLDADTLEAAKAEKLNAGIKVLEGRLAQQEARAATVQ